MGLQPVDMGSEAVSDFCDPSILFSVLLTFHFPDLRSFAILGTFDLFSLLSSFFVFFILSRIEVVLRDPSTQVKSACSLAGSNTHTHKKCLVRR